MNINIDSKPRDEVKSKARNHAVGGDVFPVGPGLAYVTNSKPVTTFHDMVADFGWYVDSVYKNQETNEIAVIIMPLSIIGQGGDE